MGELQNTLALLVVTSMKSAPVPFSLKARQGSLEYGALGEVVVVASTRSQLCPSLSMPTAIEDSIA
jgi:hypothetical protein